MGIKENITDPEDITFYYARVLKDRYWVLNEQGQICLYNEFAPMCNANETIGNRIVKGLSRHTDQELHLELIPIVFLPDDHSQYV